MCIWCFFTEHIIIVSDLDHIITFKRPDPDASFPGHIYFINNTRKNAIELTTISLFDDFN